jgi:hypothetical protein
LGRAFNTEVGSRKRNIGMTSTHFPKLAAVRPGASGELRKTGKLVDSSAAFRFEVVGRGFARGDPATSGRTGDD